MFSCSVFLRFARVLACRPTSNAPDNNSPLHAALFRKGNDAKGKGGLCVWAILACVSLSVSLSVDVRVPACPPEEEKRGHRHRTHTHARALTHTTSKTSHHRRRERAPPVPLAMASLISRSSSSLLKNVSPACFNIVSVVVCVSQEHPRVRRPFCC